MRVTDSIKPNSPYIVGVAGGSGSGKTYFATALRERLGAGLCELIYQDNFYFDQSSRFDYDGGAVNFDHPDSIDFRKLAECLNSLRNARATEIPVYDFTTHSRRNKTVLVQPKPIILVDGILIFHDSDVRECFDDLVFFDTPEDLRFQRRFERDVSERGRTPEGVRSQFFNHVKPMHDQFVEPSKRYAKTVVRDLGEYDQILETYGRHLLSRVAAT